MDYNTLSQTLEQATPSKQPEVLSLYKAFEQVKDGRKKRGVRYPLALVLTLVVLAKLAGETSLSGVAQWVRERKEYLAQALQLPSTTRFPCVATYSNVLRQVDAEELTSLIYHFFTQQESKQRCGNEPSRLLNQPGRQHKAHLALDGKTLRGTLGHTSAQQTSVHLLSLYETRTGVVLAQHQVGEKENEISAVKSWLQAVQVQDRIVSADAMHTQRFFCALLRRLRSHYLLIAKKNQPQLYEDLHLFFEDPQADRSDWQSAQSCSKGHGRLERREITTSTELNSFFERDWQGIEQVFRLERNVTRKGETRQEVVYGLTSLPRKLADPARLLQVNRAHWQIENRLHWRRDVTLGEDGCQVRTGQAPQVLAALNNAVLALADALHVSNLAAQMRSFDAHPEQALALLLGSDF
jgi:predicted transposase YbfD/YdcC